ncbi:HNH endonuclease [Ensifer sp. PDNC004]|uniref:HNH endonuclease signature motif containing protein n=1 Tax=Ensifer sp. PDNC004 TaxID=2811423 RepID=UPI001963CCCC|nr:HNH endonuclease signature motif containing protein [Ensifer sp. PDNC004]QRY69132.1 HNH endonuclease [Ensifer sp. PDNC004]
MKGKWISYSAAEMEWLEANRTLPIGDYHRVFSSTFQRDDVSAVNLHALRKRKGWKTGRTGCFVKGQVPVNKGVPCEPGKGGRHPNARRTQFKAGGLPHNTKFLGHERVSKDGYVEISIDEQNPHTGYERRYVLKHVYLWEQVNGPIPDGMCLKSVDGNRLNTDPANWLLIPRGVLPRLNGGRATRVMAYDTAPDELKPVLMTIARVDHKASELRRGKQEGK